jgi:steroid delta-isomerase-like uncharacterized protein
MATPALDAVLEEWAAAWSSHDTEGLLALFTDDCVYEDVTFGVVTHGKQELRVFADGAFAAAPDTRFELTCRFVEASRGAMEWVMSGTHRGAFPGLPGTGMRFSVRGATLLELRSGRIRRNSDYWDAATFMRQVGLLPLPSQSFPSAISSTGSSRSTAPR